MNSMSSKAAACILATISAISAATEPSCFSYWSTMSASATAPGIPLIPTATSSAQLNQAQCTNALDFNNVAAKFSLNNDCPPADYKYPQFSSPQQFGQAVRAQQQAGPNSDYSVSPYCYYSKSFCANRLPGQYCFRPVSQATSDCQPIAHIDCPSGIVSLCSPGYICQDYGSASSNSARCIDMNQGIPTATSNQYQCLEMVKSGYASSPNLPGTRIFFDLVAIFQLPLISAISGSSSQATQMPQPTAYITTCCGPFPTDMPLLIASTVPIAATTSTFLSGVPVPTAVISSVLPSVTMIPTTEIISAMPVPTAVSPAAPIPAVPSSSIQHGPIVTEPLPPPLSPQQLQAQFLVKQQQQDALQRAIFHQRQMRQQQIKADPRIQAQSAYSPSQDPAQAEFENSWAQSQLRWQKIAEAHQNRMALAQAQQAAHQNQKAQTA